MQPIKDLKSHINPELLPQHIAIIMDGNGRWAKKRGLPRVVGHEYGVKAVREITTAAAEIGIPFLTLYTFSTENWKRPALEITGLMSLLVRTIRKEITTLMKQNIKLQTIGDIASLPHDVHKELLEAIEKTKDNTRMTLVLALNYSARWDLVNATKNIASQCLNQQLNLEDIDSSTLSSNLSTALFPNPELIIRTSGEFRISNFLLWESAYSEYIFTETFWPEYSKQHFYEALINFQNRERRFGKISEQLYEK